MTSPRIARPFAILLVVSLAIATPLLADCLDWTVPASVDLAVAWDGPEFHGLTGGTLHGGFLLRTWVDWYDGNSWIEHGYLYDVHEPVAPAQIVHIQNFGGPEDTGGITIEAAAGPRCLLRIPGVGVARRLVTLTADGVAQANVGGGNGAALAAGHGFWNLTSPSRRLAFYDLSGPSSPLELGSLAGEFDVCPFPLDEARVLVEQAGTVRIADFTDPAAPVLRGAAPADVFQWLGRVGELVVASSWTQIWAFDATDPDALHAAWTLPGHATALASRDQLMVLQLQTAPYTLQLFDLSGGAPVPLGAPIAQLGSVWPALAWHGDVLYTSRIAAIDLSDPAVPTILGTASDEARSLDVLGGWLASPDGLYPLHCAGALAAPTPAVPTLAAAPNPFNPCTVLRFQLSAAAPVRLSLHDLRGRRVRTLLAADLTVGTHAVAWDGRDESGQPVATGVYLARLRTADRVVTTRLALLR
ncbi:MAG: FlgD immunoglobulin-like domain containing protein [Candidatus Krumholzibacteriia bacterium]